MPHEVRYAGQRNVTYRKAVVYKLQLARARVIEKRGIAALFAAAYPIAAERICSGADGACSSSARPTSPVEMNTGILSFAAAGASGAAA